MSTPKQIVSFSSYVVLLQSDNTIWYSKAKLPLSWAQLTFGGTGIPASIYITFIENAANGDMKLYLCVISSDATLWAFDIAAAAWSKVTNLPP